MSLTRLGRWAGLATVVVACLTGCAAENTTQSVTTQRALSRNTQCELDVTSPTGRVGGTFDVTAPAGGYVLGIEVANNTIEDRTQGGVLQSGRRVFVYQGVHVTLRLQSGAEASVQAMFNNIPANLRSYDVPGFGTIDPRVQNQAASKLGVALTVFQPQLLARSELATLAQMAGGARIIASLTVFGTIDGDDVEANTVGFPIDVCSGCLLRSLGPCSGISTGFEFAGEGTCIPGQDEPVDCCTEMVGTATVLRCPGKGTMTTTTP